MRVYVTASVAQPWEMARKHIIKHRVAHEYGLYSMV